MLLVDTHCHLDLILQRTGTPLEALLESAAEQGVHQLISIATTLCNYDALKELTAISPNVALSCGVHPLSLERPLDPERLYQQAQEERAVALGETGLDYARPDTDKKAQQGSFEAHIEVARKVDKPVVVHTRAAIQDTLRMLRGGAVRGVIHCFTEDRDAARRTLDLGFYISFSGILTFKTSLTLREVARYVPLEHILLETDAPYLAPVPYRGRANQPAYLIETARCLAQLKGLCLEQVAEQTTLNSRRLFALTRK